MSKENLYNDEAKKKIKSIVEEVDFTMMCTNLGRTPISAIPMSTKEVDKDGNIWFLSGADSDHNADIKKDKNVQLLYSSGSDMKFLSVYGSATITKDLATIKDLYHSSDDSWFDGPEDPNCTAIMFVPEEAAYWDVKGNKLVALFKMVKGAITGEQQDLGVSGKIKV